MKMPWSAFGLLLHSHGLQHNTAISMNDVELETATFFNRHRHVQSNCWSVKNIVKKKKKKTVSHTHKFFFLEKLLQTRYDGTSCFICGSEIRAILLVLSSGSSQCVCGGDFGWGAALPQQRHFRWQNTTQEFVPSMVLLDTNVTPSGLHTWNWRGGLDTLETRSPAG